MKITSITPFSEQSAPSTPLLSSQVAPTPQLLSPYSLPMYDTKVQAGFLSPADDHISGTLDLNTYLIHHPASTFFVRVAGDSMIDAGIRENDLLIVDKSLEATNGRIVIAVVDGEFTVKRLRIDSNGDIYLIPENKAFLRTKLGEGSYIWGVVTNVIHEC